MDFKIYFSYKPSIIEDDSFDDLKDLAKLFIQILNSDEDLSFLEWDHEPDILQVFIDSLLTQNNEIEERLKSILLKMLNYSEKPNLNEIYNEF